MIFHMFMNICTAVGLLFIVAVTAIAIAIFIAAGSDITRNTFGKKKS